MTDSAIVVVSRSESETDALGAIIAAWLHPGDTLLLHGDLGAGKTALAKSIGSALGVADVMSSPTFALVNEHATAGDLPIKRMVHLDLYRLECEDLDSFGYADVIANADAVTLIEWPARARETLPDRFLLIEIIAVGPSQRQFRFLPHPGDERWLVRIAELRSRLAARGFAV